MELQMLQTSSPRPVLDPDSDEQRHHDLRTLLSICRVERRYLTPPMSRPTTPQHETSTKPSVFIVVTSTAASSSQQVTPLTTEPSVPAVSSTLLSSPIRTERPSLSLTTQVISEEVDTAQSAGFVQASAGNLASSSRPTRKAKAHVPSACVNCKRAHLSCDIQRPCKRCIDTGKEETCIDVQHKKRGRPRLREQTEAGSSSVQAGPSQQAPIRPIASTRSRRAESFRSHQSQGSEGSSIGLVTPLSASYGTGQPVMTYYVPPVTPVTQEVPTAFLDLDLVVVRANRAFQRALGSDTDLSRVRLADIATPFDGEAFSTIRNRLRDERERHEPAFLPPIVHPGHHILDSVEDADVDILTRGFADHTYTWTPTVGRASNYPLTARVRLAKITSYFAVVTLPSRYNMPPVYGPAIPYPAPFTSSVRQPSGYIATPPPPYAFPADAIVPPHSYPTTAQRVIEPYMTQLSPMLIQPGHLQPQQRTLAHASPATLYTHQAITSQSAFTAGYQTLSPAMPTTTAQLPATTGLMIADEGSEASSSTRTPRKRRRLGIDEVI